MNRIEKSVSLKKLNTFGVDARAQRFATVRSEEELQALLAGHTGPVRILGGGSNILLTHELEVLVIKNEIYGKTIVAEEEGGALVRAGGGENWHQFVRWCLEQNLGGVENLSLIPGTVGAAPIQNIGAYGVELHEIFDHLEAVNLETGELEVFHREACRFGYRDSIFKNEYQGRYFISAVFLHLTKPPYHQRNTSYGAIREKLREMDAIDPGIREISDAVVHIRRSKLPDPGDMGNAGSFFKNPVISPGRFEQLHERFPDMPHYSVDEHRIKIPAGWLIERCGWKGYRTGNVGCYDKQALVMVNYGGATGREILELARQIVNSVDASFGIRLDLEVNVW